MTRASRKATPIDRRPRNPRARPGFTLVELLVTVAIIAILTTFALGALFRAQESARAARTRGTIAKLHAQIMLRWESYRTRRLPVDPRQVAVTLGYSPNDPIDLAQVRLLAIRELMRCEMPERWTDINFDDSTELRILSSRPGLSAAYKRRFDDVNPTSQFQGAECLYLVVTMGQDSSLGGDHIVNAEIGDVDQDGMKEFLDGWGRPISFLRWAPGYLPPRPLDPLAPSFTVLDPIWPPPNVPDDWPAAVTDYQTGDAQNDHDPFDPLRIDQILPYVDPADVWRGYRLTPLVYSGGPDRVFDIDTKNDDMNPFKYFDHWNDPYAKNQTDWRQDRMIGTPYDPDSDGYNHQDNITNHALGAR